MWGCGMESTDFSWGPVMGFLLCVWRVSRYLYLYSWDSKSNRTLKVGSYLIRGIITDIPGEIENHKSLPTNRRCTSLHSIRVPTERKTEALPLEQTFSNMARFYEQRNDPPVSIVSWEVWTAWLSFRFLRKILLHVASVTCFFSTCSVTYCVVRYVLNFLVSCK